MALVSVSEAARLANVARSTLYAHYINRGKLSVETDGRGRRVIDKAELLRVFGELRGAGQPDKGSDYETGHRVTGETDSRTDVLDAENRLLREQLAAAGQREAWYQRQLEDLGQAVRLLEDRRNSPAAPAPVAVPARRRWWPFGGGGI